MNEFLTSLKADLLDRRVLPIVLALGIALAGALAYAALSGGGASSASTAASQVAPLSASPLGSAISVTASTAGTVQPVAETTSGSAHRNAGASRNPFAPLPGAKAAVAKSEATSGTSTPAAGSSSPGGPGAGSGTSPTIATGGGEEPAKSEAKSEAKAAPKKAKKQTVYRVAVLFGAVPAGSPVPAANLTSYANLTRQQPLPSVAQPLVVFRGVIAGAKSATFTLVGEAILRGSAVCRPSPAQCQAIDLQLGETEELEYVPAEGAPVVYQLKLVSITASKASASAARRAFASQYKGGMRLLRAVGLQSLPGLHYSSVDGVLVHAKHLTLAARAHALAWTGALRG